MCKKIVAKAVRVKKHIKRSVPLFVIFSLLTSSMAIGLVFNFDFSLDRVGHGFNMSIPTAQADTASTTVTVKNAAPTFSSNPVESPISSSTSPVNVGGTISFTATANDQEGNDYYLIVCGDNVGVTPGAGGAAPTCDSGPTQTLCVSTAYGIAATANCTYTDVDDPGAETDAWYAYVCDNHGTEADCSAANQGSGDSGSPIYINHHPFFSAVVTTADNKDPGNVGDEFVMTATATDGDVQGGADVLNLYVCQTNSFATSTGCAVELCHGTSTSPDVSCNFATTTPAADGTYTYYAFVMDWHYLQATSSRSSNYTVNNVAPTISGVDLNSEDVTSIIPNYKNVTEVVASTTATITDNNGCTDITSATSAIYWSGVAGEYDCAADDNSCYQIGAVSCTLDAGSCSGVDASSVYTCVTTIAYHALPTDASGGNVNAGDIWMGAVRGFDDNGLSGVGTSTLGNSLEMETVTFIYVDTPLIPYGDLQATQNTGLYNATTTVTNGGNGPINSYNDGDHMVKGGDTIRTENQRFGVTPATYASLTYFLPPVASSTPQLVDIVVPPTTSQASTSDDIYWGIKIPPGTLSGVYNGTNYFLAAHDATGW